MQEIISLDGIWNLKNREKKINIHATVPGTVFETLIKEKLIEDPFYGTHEHKMGWVYGSDWEYERIFEIESKFNNRNVILRLNGIDTIANIYLNDEKIGSTKNMYRTYELNVNSALKKGQNRLKIIIKSPTEYANQQIKKYKVKLTNMNGLPGAPYLRKPQYSFGWDWGPELPDIGIWKSVELIIRDSIIIDSVFIKQNFKYNIEPLNSMKLENYCHLRINSVIMEVSTELKILKDNIALSRYILRTEIKTPDNQILSQDEPLKKNNQSTSFEINNPKIWWTHDLGKQPLYQVIVSILINNEIIDQKILKIGLRDIKHIRNSDHWGETFYFLLNGIPIFAKGANWIPIDQFIPRGKKLGLYEMNLKYAKEANMNFLRVWGGGIYEDDHFYSLCDEMGILIWQDFPFACALYPTYEEFFKNVKKEAIQNIKRIRHHPSLALWCGNNEIEQLFMGYIGLYRIFNPKKILLFKKAYRMMFERLLPELVQEYDPDHSYWPSSPSNGGGNRKRGLLKSNNPNLGDSHFWKVWHLNAPFSAYRTFDSRFMSEYGFESFPSIKTLATFCPLDQFDFYSPIMENHQKNRAGNKKIMKYMKRRFSIPDDFEKQVILSQITHAEAIEYGIEHWRRNRNDFHCMGSLYWQLNDCWPVASWASLDYYCRWKALHYIAKRAYQPFNASIKEEKETVEFWFTNDLRNKRKGSLKWKIMNYKGEVLKQGVITKEILPCSSLLVEKVDVSDINKKTSDMQKNIIFFTLYDSTNIHHQGCRLFENPKNFPLKNPELTFKVDKSDIPHFQFKVLISTKHIALYVFIESENYDLICSDNYFSMEPDEKKVIYLKKKLASKTINTISEKDLTIRSLYDLLF
ncbi:MAG: beta-mannosidase [Promethearchaeota archaeon]